MTALSLSSVRIPPFRRWGPPFLRGLWSYFKKMCVWFVPMLVTASAAAWLSYYYNQKANSELAVQQQAFSDLQTFRSTGAGLDEAVSMLSDSLVDGKGVDEARAKMRAAITRHISDTTANERVLGSGSKAYAEGLSRLRLTVDAVDRDSIETGAALWEDSLRLMSQRRKLVSAAQTRVAAQ